MFKWIRKGNLLNAFSKQYKSKPHLNVGTIGHIDHGKTTLTSAITKTLHKKGMAKYFAYSQIDKSKQQKQKGITINTATIEYETQKRHYAHVDCPGHIDYVKNMITGAAKMDCGILVVSAIDGPMPQTREHVLLCRQIGVSNIIIFLNKIDDVKDPFLLDIIQGEIKDVLKKYQYDAEKTLCVRGSALSTINDTDVEIGQNKILELLQKLDSLPIPARITDKPFLMPIQTIYNIKGRGTIISGTIDAGTIKVNQQIQLAGYKTNINKKATVLGVQTFKQSLDKGQAGDNVGIHLKGIQRKDVWRGIIACKPGSLQTVNKIEANIYCLTKNEGGRTKSFTSGYKPQIYYKTTDTACQIKLSDVKIGMPGDNLLIKAQLNYPMALEVGSRFALRQGGRTIAAGIVSKLLDKDIVLFQPKVKKVPVITNKDGQPTQGSQVKQGQPKTQGQQQQPKKQGKQKQPKKQGQQQQPKIQGQQQPKKQGQEQQPNKQGQQQQQPKKQGQQQPKKQGQQQQPKKQGQQQQPKKQGQQQQPKKQGQQQPKGQQQQPKQQPNKQGQQNKQTDTKPVVKPNNTDKQPPKPAAPKPTQAKTPPPKPVPKK